MAINKSNNIYEISEFEIDQAEQKASQFLGELGLELELSDEKLAIFNDTAKHILGLISDLRNES